MCVCVVGVGEGYLQLNLIQQIFDWLYIQRPVLSAEGDIKMKRRLFLLPGRPSLVSLFIGEM